MLDHSYDSLNVFLFPQKSLKNSNNNSIQYFEMKSSECQGKCYHVFYTKDIRKKKKIFKEGVLVLSINNMAKLFDEDGQMITSFKNKEQVQVDEEYVINNSYLITIDKIGDIDEYNTGAIFTKKQMIVLPIKKKPVVGVSNNTKSKDIQHVKLECGLNIEKKLYEILRPHQKQGVQFMYSCVSGRKNMVLQGCILADYMGLGKTLQTLALSYSMIKQKDIKKFVIVCPLTLLDVWQKQTKKWLEDKLIPLTCFGDGAQTTNTVKKFTDYEYRMLIISYETFYKNIQKLSGKCDLIIFDEGHRMKNKKSKLLLKLKVFKCEKRILLTGTPIQNNLQQLYTCISIINPRMFGNQTIFKNVFQKPIIQGLGKRATQLQKQLAKQRTTELAKQLKQFSLRRTADVLKKFLPPKNEHLIFLHLTPLQKLWYERTLGLKNQKDEDMFRTLNYLRKLFIHPNIFKMRKINNGDFDAGFQGSNDQFSYKIQFTEKIIADCLQKQQKCVVVSYFTETLDFIGNKLKTKGINCVKLDGRQSTQERKLSLVKFQKEIPVLLLSGKAGGTGLTLICAVKMIMLQPDWNPSNDSQVMGRIWRQGQNKEVNIYRFLIASTFEQKILQRQGLKKTLANNLIDDGKVADVETDIDYENISKLFVENKGEVLTYKMQQNQLKQFISNHKGVFKKNKKEEVQLENGIIYVKTICSSNNQQKQQQAKKETQENQFDKIALINFCKKQNVKKNKESDDQLNQEQLQINFQDQTDQQSEQIQQKNIKNKGIKDKKIYQKGNLIIDKKPQLDLTQNKQDEKKKCEQMFTGQSSSDGEKKSKQNSDQDSLVKHQKNKNKEGGQSQEDQLILIRRKNDKTEAISLSKGPRNLLKKIIKK